MYVIRGRNLYKRSENFDWKGKYSQKCPGNRENRENRTQYSPDTTIKTIKE
jgi:hypothetical protein